MIRFFTKKDSIRCMQIIKSSVKEKVSYPNNVKDFIINFFLKEEYLERKSRETKFFVYELNNVILGMGCLDKNQIERMYIDPTYTRQGIGSQLLTYLEMIAKEDGFNEVVLHSLNNSIGFYTKQGYKIKGTHKYSFSEENISFNTSIMKKNI
ncbi:MAG: GNAT family N-acetyltransferase [Nanoarchaeota archaeon]|jgi:GNAT superfamily N-acetyltransferase|nr:GNAT family N-acetyltransferase [Nanoarchaeota archaeon]